MLWLLQDLLYNHYHKHWLEEQTLVRVKKNIITINGRDYDARTGQPIEASPLKTHNPRIITPQKTAPTPKQVHATAKPRRITVKQVTSSSRDSGQTAHTVHVKTERSKTLRRGGLNRPESIKTAKAVNGLMPQAKHKIVGIHKDSSVRLGSLKSHRIVKFSDSHPTVKHKTSSIPVRSAPPKHKPQSNYSIHDTPPAPHVAKTNQVTKDHLAAPNIFETALAAASSHQSVHRGHKGRAKSRLKSSGALVLAVVLLGAFFTYQNAPRIALNRASSKIGFKASVPGYKPAGFGLSGDIQYQPGLVLINFRSNSDDRAYTVTQTKADFDNTSLVDQLKAKGKVYSTDTVRGYKIYLTGTTATWVMHDVWYTIEGNASLSRDQLTKIAASL